MKTKLYCFVLIITSTLFSCQKELSFNTVPSGGPKYLKLGSWTDDGRPNYLLDADPISTALNSFIKTVYEERIDIRTSQPDLYTKSVNIDINQTSDVYVTFVSQGTALTDAIAFYTYPSNRPPDTLNNISSITYIFPNAGSGTPLKPGDRVKLGRFNKGISIGFVLLQSAWNPITNVVNPDAPHFFTTDRLNPEIDISLKKHAVLINYVPEKKLLIGFEDLERSSPVCDHDFNDIIFCVTITP